MATLTDRLALRLFDLVFVVGVFAEGAAAELPGAQ